MFKLTIILCTSKIVSKTNSLVWEDQKVGPDSLSLGQDIIKFKKVGKEWKTI